MLPMPHKCIAADIVTKDNPITFPINSERMFAAIKGHGGTAHFVFLPVEISYMQNAQIFLNNWAFCCFHPVRFYNKRHKAAKVQRRPSLDTKH